MTAVKQADVNKAAWDACDTFRGTIDPSAYKDYILVFLFCLLKCLEYIMRN